MEYGNQSGYRIIDPYAEYRQYTVNEEPMRRGESYVSVDETGEVINGIISQIGSMTMLIIGLIGSWIVIVYYTIVTKEWWLLFVGVSITISVASIMWSRSDSPRRRPRKYVKSLSELESEYNELRDYCDHVESMNRHDPICK